MSPVGPLRFFATAAKGTEPALRDELRSMRFWQWRWWWWWWRRCHR